MKPRTAQTLCLPCGRVRAALHMLWWRRHAVLAALVATLVPVVPGEPGALAAAAPPVAPSPAAGLKSANTLVTVPSAADRAASAAIAAAHAATLAAAAANAAAAAAQDVANATRARAGAVPAAAAASAPELIYVQLILVRLTLGQDWKGLPLVRYGKPPYTLQYDSDALPPGMSITEEGVLVGAPTKADRYPFVLRLVEPGRTLEQRYRIDVVPPTGPPRPAASAPLTSLSALQAGRSVDTAPNQPRIYRLSKADVAELLLPSEEAAKRAEQDAEDGQPPAVPLGEQLQQILGPLEDVEFPTESLLRHALLASTCRYYKAHVEAVAAKEGRGVDSSCPPPRSARHAAMPWDVWVAAAAPGASAVPASVASAPAKAGGRAVSGPRTAGAAPGAGSASAASAPSRGREAAPAGSASLRQFFDDLLNPAFRDEIVAKAEKPLPFRQKAALKLETTAGCGCTPAYPADEIHGFLGYWHTRQDKDGKVESQPAQLSLYTRLNYLGAALDRDGGITTAYAGVPRALNFVRVAQRHGTRVDLAILRRDWRFLGALTAEQFDTFVARAATEAVRMLETPLDDFTASWQSLLIPAWRESDYAFEGLTLYFDDLGRSDAERANFRKFMHAFVPTLMATMRGKALPSRSGPATAAAAVARPTPQVGKPDKAGKDSQPERAVETHRTPRPYRLNIVVPDHAVLNDTGYVDWMWEVLSVAESVLTAKEVTLRRKALFRDAANQVVPGPDITVQFLVLLNEPTTSFKKWLRTRLDDSKTVKGHDRVALLQSLVPVLLHKREGEPDILPDERRQQLDDDFAYAKWNYGGVGVWPLPVVDMGRGEAVHRLLAETYAPTASLGGTACNYICPIRVPLRLLLQMLLLVGAVSVSLYAWNCEVRKIGTPYKVFLLLGAALTAAVALALLSCDPAMEHWRRANAVLYAVIGLLLVGGAYFVLKPKEALP